MSNDNTKFVLFGKKNLASLFEDIYNNSTKTKNQIKVLLKEVAQFVTDVDSAREMVPVIKEYLEISVKNDEQLVKLAGIVQKIIQVESRVSPSKNDFGLSEEEKEQFLKKEGIDIDFEKIKEEAAEISKDIEKIKKPIAN